MTLCLLSSTTKSFKNGGILLHVLKLFRNSRITGFYDVKASDFAVGEQFYPIRVYPHGKGGKSKNDRVAPLNLYPIFTSFYHNMYVTGSDKNQ